MMAVPRSRFQVPGSCSGWGFGFDVRGSKFNVRGSKFGGAFRVIPRALPNSEPCTWNLEREPRTRTGTWNLEPGTWNG